MLSSDLFWNDGRGQIIAGGEESVSVKFSTPYTQLGAAVGAMHVAPKHLLFHLCSIAPPHPIAPATKQES